MSIEWKQEYSVNVKEIDEQHKIFFEILKELYSSIYEMKMGENIEHIFDQLSGYVKYHFSTEEKYFEQFSCEEKDEHTKSHRDFGIKINELRKEFEVSGVIPTENLVDTVENWLVWHINSMDKKYTKCFNEHGLF